MEKLLRKNAWLFVVYMSRPLHATSHVAYFDGASVYIGSDSQRHVSTDSGLVAVTACKVAAVNGMAVVFTGVTTDTRIASGGRVTTKHSLYETATSILKTSANPDVAFEKLREASVAQVKYMKATAGDRKGLPNPDDYAIGGMMIAFIDSRPYVWTFDLITTAWGTDPVWHFSGPKRSFRPDTIQYLGEWKDAASKPLVPSSTLPGGSIALVRSFLERQHKLTPNFMGPPYTVLKLKPDSAEFVLGSATCPQIK